jgi:hypothetical protein
VLVFAGKPNNVSSFLFDIGGVAGEALGFACEAPNGAERALDEEKAEAVDCASEPNEVGPFFDG